MDKKELETIIARIHRAEQRRDSKYLSQWQDWERRYRSQPEHQREGSNLFVPHTFMQCEVIKSRVEESLFASRPYVAALPRNDGDRERAANVQTLLDWQMNDRMDLPRIISQQVMGSLVVYGTAVTYTGWLVRSRLRRKNQQVEETLRDSQGQPLLDARGQNLYYPSTKLEASRELIYDDPIVSSISLYDFFIDPEADRIEDARYLGHKEYVTMSQLKDLESQGHYHIDWDKLQSGDPENQNALEDPDEPGLYLLHHYWEDQRHVVILGRSQCALDEENPFWHGEYPYDKCCFVPLPGEFYGMGVPEILAGLQDELNTSRNQRIDYNSMSLRRMWKLRKGCGLTNSDLIWRQNGILQVENMDDVQEINLQGLPADAFANENTIKQDMQDATGCYDIVMGLGYANETATTTMTRDNNASLRFKTVVNAVVKDIMLPVARKIIALDRQFLREERAFRLLDQPSMNVFQLDPSDLGADYDVIYCGSAVESLANKELNKNKALQAYSLALGDPAYQADDQARLALFRHVLDALDMEDAEQLMPQLRKDSEMAGVIADPLAPAAAPGPVSAVAGSGAPVLLPDGAAASTTSASAADVFSDPALSALLTKASRSAAAPGLAGAVNRGEASATAESRNREELPAADQSQGAEQKGISLSAAAALALLLAAMRKGDTI